MINLKYVFQETFSSLRKNVILAIASIAVVAVSLGILGLVVLGWNVFGNMIKNTERKVGEIDVYLSDLTNEQERAAMEAFVKGIPEVDLATVTYKSKDRALEEFKQQHPENPELWEYIDENPLPASFELRTKDPKDVGKVKATIQNDSPFKERIEEVRTASQAIEKLESVYESFQYLGTIAVAILVIISMMLISVTIQVAIFARRREIAIMKLVGATNWFIRWPFLTEGVMEGLTGSVIAVVVVLLVKVWIWDRLAENLSFLKIHASAMLIPVLVPSILLVGILLGAIGSLVALRRFLEV
jgi:cell division transport system permease protein